MDDSMGDSPGSLDRAWPVVSNTWMPVPNFLDDDADDVRNLSTLYSAISPQRSRAPQSSNGRDFAAGSPRPASGRATSRASRLQQQWDIITGPVTSSAEAFAPLQAIPERGAGAMDLDEEISDGYTMGEFWGVVNGEGGEVS
ncbi:hypothetical protein Trco_002320 [Trichoderma cornu-damae]|uniref:Uncharacterized protein n=1 Tax=Trichoderma cornu-damae TaxID=654480 RepID=A0A9P8TXQ1_9HYPO|nr:hypothetical protein Trco_002320 [Trichoderma cornu-damae]